MVKRHIVIVSVSVGLLWEKHEINSNRRAVTPRSLPICGGQETGTEILAASCCFGMQDGRFIGIETLNCW